VRALRIPLVWNIWLARQFGRWTKTIYNFCYFLPNHIVTEYRGQSSNLFRRLQASRRMSKISTVYTGIDASFCKDNQTPVPMCILPLPADDSCHLLSCCRITPRKDVGCLLDALAILAKRGKNIQLTIVGSPFSDLDRKYYSQLIEQVDRDGIGSLVQFTEWRENVRSLLEGADIYISSSSDEGLPGAVREAQAVGLPVVATDAGGTCEAVLNGVTGLIVPCHDARALADSIEKLAGDSVLARQFGMEGQRRTSELFTTEKFIQDYCGVFRRLLSA
jgi:glycosyltransferase involved in cell wall biosynthesis